MPTYTNTQWLTQLAADIAALQAGTMTQAQFVTAMQSYTDGWVGSSSATSASNAATAVQNLVQQVTLRDNNLDAWVGGTLTGGYTDSTGTTLGGPYYPLTTLAGGTVYMMCPAGVQALAAKGNPAGVVFNFNTATSAADPGSGKFAFDSATLASIAHLYISNTENYGSDVTAWLAAFSQSTTTPNPGVLYFSVNTTNGFLLFKITGAITNNGTYTTVPVSYVDGSGLPATGTRMAVVFTPTGNRGAALLPGHGTPTGAVGADGDSYLNLDTGDFWTRASGVWSGPYSNLNTLFETTSLYYSYGRAFLWAIDDANRRIGAGVSTDGYFFAKHAFDVPISNGLTISRDASTGFYHFKHGTVEGQLPMGAAGDVVDTTTPYWFNGKQVLWGVRGVSGYGPLFITSDGYVQAKLAVRQTIKNGLNFTRGVDGFYTLSFGSTENVLPLGTAGDGIDTSGGWYLGGQQVLWALQGASGKNAIAVTADGYLRAKLPIIQSIQNGLTFTKNASGLYTLAFGSTENQLPIGASGGVIDSSGLWYFAGQQVYWGVQGPNGHTPVALTADGYLRAKYAIQLGIANGLTFTKAATGMYTLSLGSVANQLPLGTAGDVVDTTGIWYYGGSRVVFARQDTNGRASYIETVDGKVYIPDLVLGSNQANTLDKGLDTSSYIYTSTQVSGKYQIFRTTKATGAGPTQTTFTGNNLNPVLSSDGANIIYSSDRLGGRDLFYQPLAGMLNGKDHPVFPTAGAIACYGDSLTAGNEGNVSPGTYPGQLSTDFSPVRTAYNYGIGGQKSTQIAMRQGGVATQLTVSGNSIASGSNSVTAINGQAPGTWGAGLDPDYRLLSTPADQSTRSCTGTIVGVHGTLTRSVSSGSEVYTFTPDASATGLPVSCPSSSTFVVDVNASDDMLQCLWLGRNNYGQTTQVENDISGCVSNIKPLVRRYVVMSVINGNYSTEWSGGSGYTAIASLNSALASAYPNNYVDVRAALVAAYDNTNAADVVDHGNDVPPFSLRAKTSGYSLTAAMASTDTSFAFTGGTLAAGQVIQIGTEFILLAAVSGSSVTSCTRGYGGSTAAAYSSGQGFLAADQIHLNAAGYGVVATAVYNFIHGKGW